MPSPGTPIPAADVALAQQRNAGPSTIGTSDLTAQSYSSEAALDTVTVPVVSGRKYKVSYLFHYTPSGTTAAGNAWTVRIREGTISGSQLVYASAIARGQNAGIVDTGYVEVEYTATSTGNQQFTTTAARSSGANNIQFKGATGQARKLSVEWLGANA